MTFSNKSKEHVTKIGTRVPTKEKTHGEHEEYKGWEPERQRKFGTGRKGQDSIGGCCMWTERAKTGW